MKSSAKRKRTKEELEEVKQEEDALMEDKQSFLQEVRRLKEVNAEMAEALQAIAVQQQIFEDQNNQMRQQEGQQQFII